MTAQSQPATSEPPIPWPVEVDPDLPHEGLTVMELDYTGRAWPTKILLREPNGRDGRVLLHELLHALVATCEPNVLPPGPPEHEAMVRHLTAGLWDAGYRRTEP